MSPVPVPVLFGVIGSLLVVTIYFVWARKISKS
jgi:hypothetical protein